MRPEPWGTRARRAARRPAGAAPAGGARPRRGSRSPSARAEALAGERPAGLRVRPLRGHRRSGSSSTTARGAGSARSRLGDYVLNGGEVAALVVVEAVVRLLPGVRGQPGVARGGVPRRDGLLEYPVYTKPPAWRGLEVPEVLLSGDHARIARWRRDDRPERTAARRPDLIAALARGELDKHDLAVLATLGWQPVDGRLDSSPTVVVADLSVGARRSRLCHRGTSTPSGSDPDAPDHQTKDAGPACTAARRPRRRS